MLPEDGQVVVYDIDLEYDSAQALTTDPINIPPSSLPMPGALISATLTCRIPIAALSDLS